MHNNEISGFWIKQIEIINFGQVIIIVTPIFVKDCSFLFILVVPFQNLYKDNLKAHSLIFYNVSK